MTKQAENIESRINALTSRSRKAESKGLGLKQKLPQESSDMMGMGAGQGMPPIAPCMG